MRLCDITVVFGVLEQEVLVSELRWVQLPLAIMQNVDSVHDAVDDL